MNAKLNVSSWVLIGAQEKTMYDCQQIKEPQIWVYKLEVPKSCKCKNLNILDEFSQMAENTTPKYQSVLGKGMMNSKT